jgi:hypothetical protein
MFTTSRQGEYDVIKKANLLSPNNYMCVLII